jgi:Coenzyme PQQ synthesis protein D (PqqD)
MQSDEVGYESVAPRGRDDVVFRSVSGEWVLYDPTTRDLHVLNAAAAAVWSCCDGSLDVEGIAAELAAHLDGVPDIDTLREDVSSTVERFTREGLLK